MSPGLKRWQCGTYHPEWFWWCTKGCSSCYHSHCCDRILMSVSWTSWSPYLLSLLFLLWLNNLTWHIYLLIESVAQSGLKWRSVWLLTTLVLHPATRSSHLNSASMLDRLTYPPPLLCLAFSSLQWSYLHGRGSERGALCVVQSDE